MMPDQDQDQEFDLELLQKQILDNSLSLIAYHDINCRYPEQYEIRRSSVLKKRMTNHISLPFYQYNILLYCKGTGFIDTGVIHPVDLANKVQEHGYTIRITNVKINEVKES